MIQSLISLSRPTFRPLINQKKTGCYVSCKRFSIHCFITLFVYLAPYVKIRPRIPHLKKVHNFPQSQANSLFLLLKCQNHITSAKKYTHCPQNYCPGSFQAKRTRSSAPPFSTYTTEAYNWVLPTSMLS